MNTIRPQTVLLFFDYPQVFIGLDQVDSNYVCMVVEEHSSGPQYLCVKISQSRRREILSGNVDLREVFDNPELPELCFATVSEGGESFSVSTDLIQACPKVYLPDAGLFFGSEDEVARNSKEICGPVSYVSLSVPEAEKETRIASNKLAEFLALYQNLIKNLSARTSDYSKHGSVVGNCHETDVFGFSHGSFTIKIRSSNEHDIFGGNAPLQNAFCLIDQFLSSSSDVDAAVAFLEGFKGHSAKSMIRFLEFLDTYSCPIKHSWAAPDMESAKVSRLTTNQIKTVVEACKKNKSLFIEEVVLVGVFSQANKETNSWRLVDENGDSFYGKVHEDSSVTMNGVVIGESKYRLVCEERVEAVVGAASEKKTLLIKSLDSLS